MANRWIIYMKKDTGQFYVRNTIENGGNPDPEEYIYVDSAENKEEAKENLSKCISLGYDGYIKWKLKKMQSQTKNSRIRGLLSRLK